MIVQQLLFSDGFSRVPKVPKKKEGRRGEKKEKEQKFEDAKLLSRPLTINGNNEDGN